MVPSSLVREIENFRGVSELNPRQRRAMLTVIFSWHRKGETEPIEVLKKRLRGTGIPREMADGLYKLLYYNSPQRKRGKSVKRSTKNVQRVTAQTSSSLKDAYKSVNKLIKLADPTGPRGHIRELLRIRGEIKRAISTIAEVTPYL